ncbi:putative lipoprotein LppI (plasmid) [Mycobacterium branderi]|nr:putative lipoprotein LppI [Mycobacterium branderi]
MFAAMMATLLAAACARTPHPAANSPESASSTLRTPSSTVPAQPPAPAQPPPPGPGASPAALAAWIQAGTPVNAADFHTVALHGTAETLDDPADVAFRSPGPHNPDAVAGCITQLASSPELVCLPPLKNPPKRPDRPGEWIGNWVTFDGASITVGSFHGDPGPFNDGAGKPLPYGDTISFGDYQCRSDPSGMYCLSRSHHSGLAMSTTLTAYGCVTLPTHPKHVGEQFTCG